jgi:hypothetical protein
MRQALRKLLFFYVFILFASTNIFAQQMKYHRIQATLSPNKFKKVMQRGMEIDHYEFKNGVLIAEVSDNDIKLLKANSVKFEYIIEDIEKNIESYNAKIDRAAAEARASETTNALTVPTPNHFGTGGSYGTTGGVAKHFTFQEMQNELDEMRALYPNLITVKSSIGSTDQGRSIFMVRISDNADVDENEPEVLLNGVHHAREPISMSQLIFFMWHVLENYDTDKELQTLVNSTEMYIVPCVNPDGYEYNRSTNPTGGGMWRKNRHLNSDGTYGVDNNRNYSYDWGGAGASASTNSETYRGARAFSEAENIAIKNFTISRNFVSALNTHAYGNYCLYPYSSKVVNTNPEIPLFTQLSSFLTQDNNFLTGNCQATLGYIASGDAVDWGYGDITSKPKMYTFTPEIGGSSDGFYPAASRIIPLCNAMMVMNKNILKVSTSYGLVTTTAAASVTSLNGTIPFNIQHFGIYPGTYVVGVSPLSSYVTTIDAVKTISSGNIFQIQNDVFNYTIDPATPIGTVLQFEVSTNNSYTTRKDTITITVECASPTSNATTGITTTSANISWTNVGSNTDYYLSTKPASSASWSADSLVAGNTFILTNLIPNTTYNWRVRTLDCTTYSTAQSFTTLNVCAVPNPSATASTTSSFTLTWPAIASANSYDVQTRLVGSSAWTSSTVTTTSKLVSGLLSGNTYEYQVSANCPSGASGFSVVKNVTTSTLVYCANSGSNNTKEWIDYIQLASINRVSAAEPNGYTNTGLSTSLTRGASYTITFSAGFSAGIVKENWKMYIDYNGDGDYNDANENIVNTNKTGAGNFTATFTVPNNAIIGNVGMRVKMSPKGISNACSAMSSGEVEDYSILTTVGAEGKNANNPFIAVEKLNENWNARVIENPFKNNINIVLDGKTDNTTIISLMNVAGKVAYKKVLNITTLTHSINTTQLPNGMYLLVIQNGENKKSIKLIK